MSLQCSLYCVSHQNTLYLQRHGVAQDQPVLFDNGYMLGVNACTAPATNESYPQIFGDYNPIHINPSWLHCQALLPMAYGLALPFASMSRL
jgi:hypothetical protein